MTGLVKGHDFSRADKGNQINRALAPAKVGAQEITPGRTVSAASLALEKCSPSPLPPGGPPSAQPQKQAAPPFPSLGESEPPQKPVRFLPSSFHSGWAALRR